MEPAPVAPPFTSPSSSFKMSKPPPSTLSEAMRQVRVSYEVAKKRAAELSALSIDCPMQLKSRLTLTSKLYLSLSTIFYTTLTLFQLGDLYSFVKESSLQLPISLFDMKEWESSLAISLDLRLKDSQNLTCKSLGQDALALKDEVEVLKKRVQNQVDSMVSVFEQMKMQIVSVLRGEESKIKKMEQDLIEKDQIIRDHSQRWNSNKQSSSDETTKLHAYYENILAEQKARLTKEYDFAYEEKLIGVNSIYEERIRKIEEGHNIKVGELNGMMTSLKAQLSTQAEDKKLLEDKLDNERRTSASNLSDIMSSNREVVGLLNQRILELESKNHQLMSKMSAESLTSNDKISAAMAQMNDNLSGLRSSYEQTLVRKDKEIANLKSDFENVLLKKDGEVTSLKLDIAKLKGEFEDSERKFRDAAQFHEINLLKEEANFKSALVENDRLHSERLNAKEKGFGLAMNEAQNAHALAMEESNKCRNNLQRSLDESQTALQSSNAALSQIKEAERDLISNHDKSVLSQVNHIKSLEDFISDLQRDIQSNNNMISQAKDKNDSLQLSLDQSKKSQNDGEYQLKSSIYELQSGIDRIRESLCIILSSFKFSYDKQNSTILPSSSDNASSSMLSPERSHRPSDKSGRSGDKNNNQANRSAVSTDVGTIGNELSRLRVGSNELTNSDNCNEVIRSLMNEMSIKDVRSFDLDLAWEDTSTDLATGSMAIMGGRGGDDAEFERKFDKCWGIGRIRARVHAIVSKLSIYKQALSGYYDVRDRLVEEKVRDESELVYTRSKLEQLDRSYKALSSQHSIYTTSSSASFERIKISQRELLDAIAAISDEMVSGITASEQSIPNQLNHSDQNVQVVGDEKTEGSSASSKDAVKGGEVAIAGERGKALRLMGVLNVSIFSITAQDLLDKGSLLDKQDPMVKIKIFGQEFETERLKDAGTSGSFPEVFELDIDGSGGDKCQIIEVEAFNKSITGSETSLGKGVVVIESLREYLVHNKFKISRINYVSVDLYIDTGSNGRKKQGKVEFKLCVHALGARKSKDGDSIPSSESSESRKDEKEADSIDKLAVSQDFVEINNKNVSILNLFRNNANLISALYSKLKSSQLIDCIKSDDIINLLNENLS